MREQQNIDTRGWTMPQWSARLTPERDWRRGLWIIETQVPAAYREAVRNHYRTVLQLRRRRSKPDQKKPNRAKK